MSDWIKYVVEAGADCPPLTEWGKDHWSTLAYLEEVCVNKRGLIENLRMRCQDRLHREFSHGHDASKYPTRLKHGKTIERHDDWSCLEDMVIAGLIDAEFRQVRENAFGCSEGKVRLTSYGWKVAGMLRRYLAEGGLAKDFSPFSIGEAA